MMMMMMMMTTMKMTICGGDGDSDVGDNDGYGVDDGMKMVVWW